MEPFSILVDIGKGLLLNHAKTERIWNTFSTWVDYRQKHFILRYTFYSGKKSGSQCGIKNPRKQRVLEQSYISSNYLTILRFSILVLNSYTYLYTLDRDNFIKS